MKRTNTAIGYLLLAGVLLFTGCVRLWRGHIEQKTYLLSVERRQPMLKKPKGRVLWIDRVNTLPPYNVRSLIIKKGSSEYTASYYNELLISPSENVRNVFFNWFVNSGIFEDTTLYNPKEMSHRLSVSLLEMYIDDSTGEPRQVVVTLKVALIEETSGKILLNRNYKQSVSVDKIGVDAEAEVKALNKAFELILEECENDIIKAL